MITAKQALKLSQTDEDSIWTTINTFLDGIDIYIEVSKGIKDAANNKFRKYCVPVHYLDNFKWIKNTLYKKGYKIDFLQIRRAIGTEVNKEYYEITW